MELYLSVVILALLVVIVVLLVRPRKIEVPAIEDLEKKLLFALASEKSLRDVQEILEKLPLDVEGD